MRKKLLAMLLAVVLTAGLLPGAARAEEATAVAMLSDPTDLYWEENPGWIHWKGETFKDGTELKIYQIGSDKPVYETVIPMPELTDQPKVISFGEDAFIYANLFETKGNEVEGFESGDYYFTIQSLGDGINYDDSDVVSSLNFNNGVFHYVKPKQKLAAAGQVKWDWPAATWKSDSQNTSKVFRYMVDYGFSADKNGDIKHIGGAYSGTSGKEDKHLQEWLIAKYGTGYYYFRVIPISKNILQWQTGNWSDWSEGHYVRSDSLDNGDPDPIFPDVPPASGTRKPSNMFRSAV